MKVYASKDYIDGYIQNHEDEHEDIITFEDTNISLPFELTSTIVYPYLITYGNGRYIVFNRGDWKAAYSDDGLNWTETKPPLYSSQIAVTYGAGKFVVVSGKKNAEKDGCVGFYSIDGINWIETSIPVGDFCCVEYGDGLFVAASEDGHYFAYSNDGVQWNKVTCNQAYWSSVAYGNGRFVIAGDAIFSPFSNSWETALVYSDDGIKWSNCVDPCDPVPYSKRSIKYGNGVYVRLNSAAYSTDGITFNAIELPFSPKADTLEYGDGKFVVATSDNHIGFSYDGINWELSSDETPGVIYKIAYGGGRFIATSESGNILKSNDGITWTGLKKTFKNNSEDVTDVVKESLGILNYSKSELISEVLAALPTWTGGSY